MAYFIEDLNSKITKKSKSLSKTLMYNINFF